MSKPKEAADADLMNELVASQGKNDKPLWQLMVRYEQLVLNTLRRGRIRGADADDVSARVWERVWRLGREGSWSSGRAVHSTDPFVPLLKKITKNLALDFHRQATCRKKRRDRLVEVVQLFGDGWQSQGRAVTQKPRRPRPAADGVPACLQAAVATLPENLRHAYALHAQGLGCRKIAARLRCSPASASRWVCAARARLQAAAGSRGRSSPACSGCPRRNRPGVRGFGA